MIQNADAESISAKEDRPPRSVAEQLLKQRVVKSGLPGVEVVLLESEVK